MAHHKTTASRLLPLIIIFAFSIAGVVKCAQSSIIVAVSAPKDKFKAGSELDLKIIVTNISDHDIHLPLDKSSKAELNQYRFNVARSDDQPVLTMKYYWELNGEVTPKKNVKDPDKTILIVFDHGSILVGPGKTIEYHTNLCELYDLSQPGDYIIQVEKIDPSVHTIVKSNVVKISLIK